MTSRRDRLVGEALGAVASLGRDLTAARRTPFGELRLTGSQLEALFLLAHTPSPMTPGLLAQRLGVTPGAVTQLIDGLRELDLVDQIPNPDDARSRHLVLSEPARGAVTRFEHETVERMTPAFSALSTAELTELGRLLRIVGMPDGGARVPHGRAVEADGTVEDKAAR